MRPFVVLIPAAGASQRFGGDRPKQFQSFLGQSLLAYTVSRFLSFEACQRVMVALPEFAPGAGDLPADTRVSTCAGGASRGQSVARALAACELDDDACVLVHDAARPLVFDEDLDRLLAVFDPEKGHFLAGPCVDTLRSTQGHTLNRDEILRVYTPQMASAGCLNEALAHGEGTDEISYLQAAGVSCEAVVTTQPNIKITWPSDWAIAEYLAKSWL